MLWFQHVLGSDKIQLGSEDMTNAIFGGLDFYIENRGVTFGDFFTIYAYKIYNIYVESTKIVSKMEIMDRITKRILKMKFFENFGRNLPNFDKKCHFYKNVIYSKLEFAL